MSVLIAGDILRMVALGAMAALSLAGVIELWHLLALSVVYGVGEALFQPSFTAIVPQVVPQEDLLRANALKELVEPLGIRFVGPALGGVTIERSAWARPSRSTRRPSPHRSSRCC